MDGDNLSQKIGGVVEGPARTGMDKVADAFKSVMDGKLGPDLTNVSEVFNKVYEGAGAPVMGTAFGESLAALTGSGWGGKIIGGIAGYFLQNKGMMGWLDNSPTGRAVETGVVALGMLKQGNDVLAKMGVPGTDMLKKLFDKTPEIAVIGGLMALGYTLFKPALDPLIDKTMSAMKDGSLLGMTAKPAEAPGH